MFPESGWRVLAETVFETDDISLSKIAVFLPRPESAGRTFYQSLGNSTVILLCLETRYGCFSKSQFLFRARSLLAGLRRILTKLWEMFPESGWLELI